MVNSGGGGVAVACSNSEGALLEKKEPLDDLSADEAADSLESVVPQLRSFDHSNSLIIFDWDDTLLPSSWVMCQGLSLDKEVPEEDLRRLQALGEVVAKLISCAVEFGTVVIVTNAESGWVQWSASHFMPALVPVLSSIKIVSARSSFEAEFGEGATPLDWKLLAFKKEIGHFEATSESRVRNMLSFGDSPHERDAAIKVAESVSATWKSMKFVRRPTPEELLVQLELSLNGFGYIFSHDQPLDLMLNPQ